MKSFPIFALSPSLRRGTPDVCLRACLIGLSVLLPFLFIGCGGGSGGGTNNSATDPTVTLSADPNQLLRGQSTRLVWTSQNAASVAQSNFGVQAIAGNLTVTPLETTTYTLAVRGTDGQTKSSSVKVNVATVAVAVAPTPAVTDVLQSLGFAAQVSGAVDTSVTWNVQESSGGTITQDGVYSAPATAGTYHVRVVSHSDTSKSATVEVRVRAASGNVSVS